MQCHQDIDQRSLEMDREIARLLSEHPEFVDKARSTLKRWLINADPAVRPVFEEWEEILGSSLNKIQDVLLGEDAQSRRLRQSSPFCGILPRSERTRILLKYDKRSA